MIRLIYKSTPQNEMSAAEISGILSVARRKNAKDGITGILIYHNGQFLQVLEGEADKVDACMERVSHDKRHADISVLNRAPAKTRAFSKWLMGYENPDSLGFISKQYALPIEEVQARLDSVSDVDAPEGKKALIRQMAQFLGDTSKLRTSVFATH